MREDPDLAADFLQKYELSWMYHENALEGVIYTVQELVAGLADPAARGRRHGHRRPPGGPEPQGGDRPRPFRGRLEEGSRSTWPS